MRLAVLLSFALLGAAPSRAAVLPGAPVAVKTVDGWTLKGVWEAAQPGRPTVVLLHGTGQRKEDWARMAYALRLKGDGYFALDFRGHGESRVSPSGETLNWHKLRVSAKGQNDYEDMTRDVEAAVATMTAAGVPEESIGVMGAEVGGSIGVKYAAVHPKVPFVILLSPSLAWREVPIVNALRAFKGRVTPILLVCAEADKRCSRDTPLLYAFAKLSVGERNATVMTPAQERGTRMVRADPKLADRIADWIDDPVAPPPPAVSTAAAVGVSSAPAVPGPDAGAAPDADSPPDDDAAPDAAAPQPGPDAAPDSGLDSDGGAR
jgi:pimeloyl-ACP methyl ester carboxylesterase